MEAGLYIHIPYCLQKCRYCDFFSVPNRESAPAYARALLKEMELTRERMGEPLSVPSVFFGGGTPTALPVKTLCALLEGIEKHFSLQAGAEISLECNPGTATIQDFSLLKAAGFNRLSLGLQSTENRLLKAIGRIHSYEDFLAAFSKAREAGFDNINVDLMHGLPGQSPQGYLESLQKVCALKPEHVSAYCLILEEGTPLSLDVQEGRVHLPQEDVVADMEDTGMAYLKAHGYGRYEISNFAQRGKQCRHNLIYWNNQPYVGLGAGAHSSCPGDAGWRRWENPSDIQGYIQALQENRLPRREAPPLSKGEEAFETVMLGLRKVEGLSRAAFSARFGKPLEEFFPKAVKEIAQRGWWADTPGFAALNERGLDMLNTALVLFMEEE